MNSSYAFNSEGSLRSNVLIFLGSNLLTHLQTLRLWLKRKRVLFWMDYFVSVVLLISVLISSTIMMMTWLICLCRISMHCIVLSVSILLLLISNKLTISYLSAFDASILYNTGSWYELGLFYPLGLTITFGPRLVSRELSSSPSPPPPLYAPPLLKLLFPICRVALLTAANISLLTSSFSVSSMFSSFSR